MAQWSEESLQKLAEAVAFHLDRREPAQPELDLGYGGNVISLEAARARRAMGGCRKCGTHRRVRWIGSWED